MMRFLSRLLMLLGYLFMALSCQPQKEAADQPASRRPNVLFISIDDLRPELGCYGHDHIHSPNLDLLASEGLLFMNAYAQQAHCAPSRTSLLTGIRPDANPRFGHVHFREDYPDIITLPQHFKNNGYHSVGLNKIYHGHDGQFNDSLSWSEPWWYPPGNYTDNIRGYLNEENLQILQKRREQEGKVAYSARSTEAEDVAYNAYPEGMVLDKAIETLDRLKDSTFFLAVGFEKPHLPFVAPKKYWELYDHNEISLPARMVPPENVPGIALTNWGELRDYADISRTSDVEMEKAKELIHGYYACVSYVDDMVGRLIGHLKKLELYDNTIIVVWGDHGWKLGDYGDWCKHTNFELDARTTLMIAAPATLQGKQTTALVELLDLYPTLSKLAGIEVPDHVEGKSFLPLFHDPDLPWKEAAYNRYPMKRAMGYSVRTRDYRYTQWRSHENPYEVIAEELYDHRTDPREYENVIADKAYQSVIEKHQGLLRKGWKNALPKE